MHCESLGIIDIPKATEADSWYKSVVLALFYDLVDDVIQAVLEDVEPDALRIGAINDKAQLQGSLFFIQIKNFRSQRFDRLL